MKKYSNPRWTIRGVEPEAREMVREVAELNGVTAGELVSEAIEYWYDTLPEEEYDDEQVD